MSHVFGSGQHARAARPTGTGYHLQAFSRERGYRTVTAGNLRRLHSHSRHQHSRGLECWHFKRTGDHSGTPFQS